MYRLAIAVLIAVSPAVRAAEPPAQKVVNPDYAAWSGFPAGTAITVKTEGGGSGNGHGAIKQWKAVETTTLAKVSPDAVTLSVEASREQDGGAAVKSTQAVTHPRLVALPPGGHKGTLGGAKGRDETVTIGGKSYKARVTTVEESNFDAEGSTRVVETWTCDEVPGRLVRRTGEMTGTYWYWERVDLTSVTRPAK